jgi:uncharacterized protein (UPF0335 family)
MTAHNHTQRETIDLLERILERVESIDKNVEDIRDQVQDGFDGLTYRDGYDDQTDDDNGYR